MPKPDKKNLLFIGANLLLLALLTFKGPVLIADSPTYLSPSPYRTPIYPLFLAALKFLSPGHFMGLAVFIQTALAMSGALLFCRALKARLGWNAAMTLSAYVLLLLPLFKIPLCPLGQEIGNTIASEGLAYPAFLGLCAAGLRALCEPAFRTLLPLAFACAFCAAIRPQLLFTYPLFLSAVLTAWHKKAVAPLKLGTALLALLLFHGAFSLSQKIYSGFSPNPFTRQQLLTTVLYVSGPEDAALFETSEDSATIKAVFSRIEELKAFAGQRHLFQRSLAEHHEQSFNPICWLSLHQSFDAVLDQNITAKERLGRLNDAYGRMLSVLVPAKKTDLAKFYLMMLWQNSSLTLLAAFCFMLYFMRVYDISRPENLFALMCWLLALCNLLLLSFSATVADRYLLYTRPLLILSLLALFHSWKKPREAAL